MAGAKTETDTLTCAHAQDRRATEADGGGGRRREEEEEEEEEEECARASWKRGRGGKGRIILLYAPRIPLKIKGMCEILFLFFKKMCDLFFFFKKKIFYCVNHDDGGSLTPIPKQKKNPTSFCTVPDQTAAAPNQKLVLLILGLPHASTSG